MNDEKTTPKPPPAGSKERPLRVTARVRTDYEEGDPDTPCGGVCKGACAARKVAPEDEGDADE